MPLWGCPAAGAAPAQFGARLRRRGAAGTGTIAILMMIHIHIIIITMIIVIIIIMFIIIKGGAGLAGSPRHHVMRWCVTVY